MEMCKYHYLYYAEEFYLTVYLEMRKGFHGGFTTGFGRDIPESPGYVTRGGTIFKPIPSKLQTPAFGH